MTKNKSWLVYILRCSDGSLYTGITVNIEQRLKRHNAGQASKYTRSRLPVKMVWHEDVESESAARKKEAQIKKISRAEKLNLIKLKRRPSS